MDSTRVQGEKVDARGLGSNPGFRATGTIDNRQDPDQQGSRGCSSANQHNGIHDQGVRVWSHEGSGDDRGYGTGYGTLLTRAPPITTVRNRSSYELSRVDAHPQWAPVFLIRLDLGCDLFLPGSRTWHSHSLPGHPSVAPSASGAGVEFVGQWAIFGSGGFEFHRGFRASAPKQHQRACFMRTWEPESLVARINKKGSRTKGIQASLRDEWA